MRDKQNGAAEGRQSVEQHVLGAHIQMVGRLVEQQKIRRRNQNPRQRKAVALAAREHAQRLEDIVAAKQKAAQQRAQLAFRHFDGRAADLVQHARLAVEHLVLVLRKIFADHVVAQLDAARCGRLGLGQQANQRGFARAVDAHQRHAVAALDAETDALEHLLGAIILG